MSNIKSVKMYNRKHNKKNGKRKTISKKRSSRKMKGGALFEQAPCVYAINKLGSVLDHTNISTRNMPNIVYN
jgi:hypothetical protein